MNKSQEYYNEYYIKNVHKLDNLFKTILELLGLKLWVYLRIYDDGHYLIFSNDQILTKNYLYQVKSSHVFVSKILDKKFFNGRHFYFSLWPTVPQNQAMHVCINKGYWNGMSVSSMSKDNKRLEIWAMSGSINDKDISRYSQLPIENLS